ncbi:MAG: MFS transporter [Firmicutes bacterium]|nr:MFS transporter [Alicyclobacillaceae bacterium]MCL6498290.1 MFS transporter [Bacillota bacterium]
MDTSVQARNGALSQSVALGSFVATLIGIFAMEMSNLGWSPLAGVVAKAWHIGFGQLGLLLGLGGPALIVMGLPSGWLVERFGEKMMFVVGAVVTALGLALMGLASGFGMGLLGRALWQLSYGLAFVSALTAMAKTIPEKHRSASMGIFGAVSAVAAAFGAPFGGWIASTGGWQRGFFAFAAMAILGAILVGAIYRAAKDRPALVHGGGATAYEQPAGRSAYRSQVVWVLALGLALGDIAGITMIFFAPAVLGQSFHESVLMSSLVVSWGFLASIPINALAGWISDRIGRLPVISAILLLIAAGALLLEVPSAGVFTGAAAAVLALGFSIPNMSFAFAADILAGREVGPIMGIMNFGVGCAVYAGPQIVGWLRAATGGFSVGWIVLSALMVASFVIFLLAARYARATAAL